MKRVWSIAGMLALATSGAQAIIIAEFPARANAPSAEAAPQAATEESMTLDSS